MPFTGSRPYSRLDSSPLKKKGSEVVASNPKLSPMGNLEGKKQNCV